MTTTLYVEPVTIEWCSEARFSVEGHDASVCHVLELLVLRLQRRQPHPVRLHQRLAGVRLDRRGESELAPEVG